MALRNVLGVQFPIGEVLELFTTQGLRSVIAVSLDGGAIPLPAVSQIVFVSSVFGNDTTGDGSMNTPYLTIAHAYSTITDASASKLYEIVLFQGSYTGDVALKPFITLVGWESSELFVDQYPTAIVGNVTLDASFSTPDAKVLVTSVDIQGTVTLDYVAASANSALISFTNCQLEDAVAITQTNEVTEFHGCTLFGDFTQHGGAVIWESVVSAQSNKTLTVAARTATSANFSAFGSSWAGALHADQNAITGVPVELTLIDSSVRGAVTITSAVTNVPIIHSEYGAIPENPTLAGSASVALSAQMRVFVALTIPSGTVIGAATVTDVLLPLAGSVLAATSIESLSWTLTPNGAAWGTQLVANKCNWSFYVVQNGATSEVHAAIQNPTDTPVTTAADLHLLAYGFLPTIP